MDTKNNNTNSSGKYRLYSSGIESENIDMLKNVIAGQKRYKMTLIKDKGNNNEKNAKLEKENSILLTRITKGLKAINSSEEYS